jgi:hypothetical protein
MLPLPGMGFHKSAPITTIAKAIYESRFASQTAPAARQKISIGLVHVLKKTGTSFHRKKRLRQVKGLLQAYYMS